MSTDPPTGRFTEGVSLIDHHVHGVVSEPLDRDGFERLISESPFPAPTGTSHFDAPVGLAIRRWCAPVLDLEPFPSGEEYLARRAELGTEEVNRRLLKGADVEALILETGYESHAILPPTAMGELAGAKAYEVVRLETVAEDVATRGVSAEDFAAAYGPALEAACREAVGLKTIVAYRHGFAFDPSPPSRREVIGSAGRWLRLVEESGEARLVDPDLLRFVIWQGAELAGQRALPIQFHAGYGDPDLTLHLTNPSLLTDLIRRFQPIGVHVVFLHCYPYHREAGYLSEVFPHVSFDVGLAINYTGPSAGRVLAEALELAPFTKQLFSSDAFGVPELHFLGALLFRRNLDAVLSDWVDRDECLPAEARRIAQRIGAENARRIYPIEG